MSCCKGSPSFRLVRDIVLDSAIILKNFKLPTVDLDDLTPHNKGNLLYNIIDDVLYYADGSRWIPLLSGTGNNILAGFGISVTSDGTNVTITNTDPGSAVTLSSSGGDVSLVFDGTGPDLVIKGLTAGTGISIVDDGSGTFVIISNTDPAGSVTLADAGVVDPHQSLVVDGTGPSLTVKGIQDVSTGILVTTSANDNIVITNTDPGSGVSLTSAGGVETLVNDGSGPALATKGLTAGTGIDLSSDLVSVTISIADGTLQTNSVSGGEITVGVPFIIPDGARDAYLLAFGGGGGAGGSTDTGEGGSGGGGAAVMQNYPLFAGDTVIAVSVGGGGAGLPGSIGGPSVQASSGGTTQVSVNGGAFFITGGQGGWRPTILSGVGGPPSGNTIIYGPQQYGGTTSGSGGGATTTAGNGQRFGIYAGGSAGIVLAGNFGGGGGGAGGGGVGAPAGNGATISGGGPGGNAAANSGAGGGGAGASPGGSTGGDGGSGDVIITYFI